MASVNITTDLTPFLAGLKGKLAEVMSKDYIPRAVANGLIDQITFRIHNKGQASDGGPIGTYSSDYLRLRQKKYQRTADTAVIVSLTRQLENDWSVLATPKGYGLGFKNSFNKDKAGWVEEIKGKKIFQLTQKEITYVQETVIELIQDAFK